MELIERAVGGDREALDTILRIYEPFHRSIAVCDTEDIYGNACRRVNEDWVAMVQMHMVTVIQKKWRRLI